MLLPSKPDDWKITLTLTHTHTRLLTLYIGLMEQHFGHFILVGQRGRGNDLATSGLWLALCSSLMLHWDEWHWMMSLGTEAPQCQWCFLARTGVSGPRDKVSKRLSTNIEIQLLSCLDFVYFENFLFRRLILQIAVNTGLNVLNTELNEGILFWEWLDFCALLKIYNLIRKELELSLHLLISQLYHVQATLEEILSSL